MERVELKTSVLRANQEKAAENRGFFLWALFGVHAMLRSVFVECAPDAIWQNICDRDLRAS